MRMTVSSTDNLENLSWFTTYFICCIFHLTISILFFLEDLSDNTEGTEAAGDFAVCGRRVVDVRLVAERLDRGCYGCEENLHLIDIVQESKSGLASIFNVKCRSCGVMNSVQTSKTVPSKNGKRRTFSINTKAALG